LDDVRRLLGAGQERTGHHVKELLLVEGGGDGGDGNGDEYDGYRDPSDGDTTVTAAKIITSMIATGRGITSL
jgi:hypothetical protein